MFRKALATLKAGRLFELRCSCTALEFLSLGNKYLSWAFIEAANHMRMCCREAQNYYERKYAKSGNNGTLATKSLAAKISKAVFYVLRDREDFDMKKIFG